MGPKRRDLGLASLIAVASVALGPTIRNLPAVSNLEYDAYLRLSRTVDDSDFGDGIMVVGLDDTALNPSGRVSRDALAEAIHAVDRGRPAAIGIDVMLDSPGAPGEDAHLEDALRRARAKVVLASSRSFGETHALPRFRRLAQAGNAEFEMLSSGAFRTAWSFDDSLAGQLKRIVRARRRGFDRALPIRFPAEKKIAELSLDDVRALEGAGALGKAFAGKAVLIGTVTKPEDSFSIPTTAYGMPKVPGVFLSAHALATALSSSLSTSDVAEIGLALFLASLAVLAAYRLSPPRFAVAAALLLLLSTFGAALLAATAGLVVNPVPALVAALLAGSTWGAVRRSRLHRGYRLLIGAPGRQSLHAVGEIEAIQPIEQTIVTMSCDIVGFGKTSRRLSPTETLRYSDAIVSPLAQIALDAGGYLDRFTGDGFLAFFGARLPGEKAKDPVEAARGAVEAALRMHDHASSQGADVGIGLNLGLATTGIMGTKEFHQFTIMGQSVNDACRIESIGHMEDLRPPPRRRLLVSESVVEALNDTFEFERKTYPANVKEFSQMVYEVLGPRLGGGR